MPRYANNETKYNVGYEFPNHKKLTKYLGSHPKWRTSQWMWECTSCNTEYGPSLINSITRLDRKPSCCYRAKGADNPTWKGYKEISGVYLNQCKYGAAKRKLEFTVTPEQLWGKWIDQQGKCCYTGRKLTHGKDASLDRIDNSQGYLPDNIQWVHTDINRMKSDFSEETFLTLCKEIVTYMSDEENLNEPAQHIFTGDPNHPSNKNIPHDRVKTNRVVEEKPKKSGNSK